jgi:hypothetical protein
MYYFNFLSRDGGTGGARGPQFWEGQLRLLQPREKSLYRNYTGIHFYGIKNEIWAGVGPIMSKF